ncbi:UNVERIFIED_CONTAM: Mitochondrial phosphate carrier protein 3, mitochondrial [Sesamum calycinum]|uniref:Mitochondrial phosphate carrier protein 3, mitochondrial n=1 Tax=Sesamum calycinum TaxID=2727403 RepID=A0AAW2LVP1_9LAMI
MAIPETPSRRSLIPSFLYSSSVRMVNLDQNLMPGVNNPSGLSDSTAAPQHSAEGIGGNFMIPAPNESGIKMFSPAFYAACTAGGILSCGLTHMAVTPLDLVKCNMQINPAKYKNISSGFGVLLKEQGVKGFFRGWVPTLLGYSAQGACKFGFYEFFKKYYSDIAAVKVRVQTQPGFARVWLMDFLSLSRLKELQHTMMKFATFENIVEAIYKYAIPTPKTSAAKACSLELVLLVAMCWGVLCYVSHPADNLVSFLNNSKGATASDAVKKLGLMGLCTRGLPLRIFMIGTLTGAQWGIYDSFKVFVGLPTTGGSPAPATK